MIRDIAWLAAPVLIGFMIAIAILHFKFGV
jgi:hypothetical protein